MVATAYFIYSLLEIANLSFAVATVTVRNVNATVNWLNATFPYAVSLLYLPKALFSEFLISFSSFTTLSSYTSY